MKIKLLGLLAFVSPLSLSPAQAATMYTYDVDYTIGGTTVTGDIVLNCDSCNVTSSTLMSWSLGSESGTTATFDGSSNLSASPSSITFTPTSPVGTTSSMFIGSSADSFFGITSSIVSGGSSGSPCSVSIPPNTNASELYGVCSNGILTLAATTTPLVIATAVTPLPAALPLFATGVGALALLCWRRKRAARSVAA